MSACHLSMTTSGSSRRTRASFLIGRVAKAPHPLPGDGFSSKGASAGIARRLYAARKTVSHVLQAVTCDLRWFESMAVDGMGCALEHCPRLEVGQVARGIVWNGELERSGGDISRQPRVCSVCFAFPTCSPFVREGAMRWEVISSNGLPARPSISGRSHP